MPQQKQTEPAPILIDFEPLGRRVEVEAGTTLLSAAQNAGVGLVALCGGEGSCDSCQVRLMRGELSPPTIEEEAIFDQAQLEAGYRLACQSRPQSDVTIEIPPESLTTPQRLQLEGQEATIDIDPIVVGMDVEVPPPSLSDLRSDVTRVNAVLSESGLTSPVISTSVLGDLSERLRSQAWKGRVAMRGQEMVGFVQDQQKLLGVAIDVGTTKIAVYLVDLETGETLAKTGAMNPQISYGEDVISRIAFANAQPDGRETLQKVLVETIQNTLERLCSTVNASIDQIVDVVVVGNTAMHHLFAGLPVQQLGAAPYVPVITEPFDIGARDLGLSVASGAYVHLPPNIAGYVGADHVSMLLSAGIWGKQGTVIAVDIGTNTEITLTVNGRMLTCSCASGPAFEGAHIRDGMRAAPGAIEHVQIDGDTIRVSTIEEQPAVGICGSGILDATAEMLGAGVMDPRGVIKEGHKLVRQVDHEVIVPLVLAEHSGHGRDIIVTRKDVNEIQLAKGAIRAGIEVLLNEAGIDADEIDEFIVAGAFGTYLDVRSAIRIGMFPEIPEARFRQVGNAAGMGAKQMLVSAVHRARAVEIVQQVEYLELTTHEAFTPHFMKAMMF